MVLHFSQCLKACFSFWIYCHFLFSRLFLHRRLASICLCLAFITFFPGQVQMFLALVLPLPLSVVCLRLCPSDPAPSAPAHLTRTSAPASLLCPLSMTVHCTSTLAARNIQRPRTDSISFPRLAPVAPIAFVWVTWPTLSENTGKTRHHSGLYTYEGIRDLHL